MAIKTAVKYQIDATDRKILHLLSNDARISFLEIARVCGMSGAAIHQRVAKLKSSGIISGYGLKLSPGDLGYQTCAFIGVFLEKAHLYHEVAEAFSKIPEIVACHYTTGNYAIFIKVYCRNNEHLMAVLSNDIQQVKGVSSTETFISLEQAFETAIEP